MSPESVDPVAVSGSLGDGNQPSFDEWVTSNDLKRNLPSTRLRYHFESFMKTNSRARLFKDWGTYYESLPVYKADGSRFKLCDVPFWTSQDQIEDLAMRLECLKDGANTERSVLPFICDKPGSGKTSSIMTGFLNSIEAKSDEHRQRSAYSYYVYMAFDSDSPRMFRPDGLERKSRIRSEFRGAEFMLGCIEKALNGEYGAVDVPVWPQDSRTVEEKINQVIKEAFPNPKHKVLFHVDNHMMMAPDDNDFRRGAITALCYCSQAQFVATGVKLPYELLSRRHSCTMCRYPVSKPTMCLPEMFCDIPELDIRPLYCAGQGKDFEDRFDTLAFQLAAWADRNAPDLHQPDGTTREFLDAFSAAVKEKSTIKCLEMTRYYVPSSDITNCDNANDITRGIDDEFVEFVDYHLTEQLKIVNGRISASWDDLACMNQPDLPAFQSAATVFCRQLSSLGPYPGSPLEAAYIWSLFALSSTGNIDFRIENASTSVKDIDFYRLFTGSSPTSGYMVSPSSLKKGTLYCAAKPGRKATISTVSADDVIQLDNQTDTVSKVVRNVQASGAYDIDASIPHPLCDVFFIDNNGGLWMIDINGGRDYKEKGKQMQEWIEKYEDVLFAYGYYRLVRGVLLNPLIGEESYRQETMDGKSKGRNVVVVLGRDARILLGALDQCFEWFKYGADIKEQTQVETIDDK